MLSMFVTKAQPSSCKDVAPIKSWGATILVILTLVIFMKALAKLGDA